MAVSHEMSVGWQEIGAAGFKWLDHTGRGSARLEGKRLLHTMIEQPLQLEEFRVWSGNIQWRMGRTASQADLNTPP